MDVAILDKLMAVIQDRQAKRPEGSYTTYLFEKGQDKILKKLGEETTEVVIASKNQGNASIVYEMADLIYHLMVLMVYHELSWDDVCKELEGRFK